MTIVIMLLWILGLGFLAILWLGATASLMEMIYGAIWQRKPATGPSHGPANPWRRGLVVGAIGYAVVVILFAGLNVLQGHSVFLTPALLGQALMGQPVGESIDVGSVLVYNGLHLVVFLALGIGAAWFLLASERHPRIWYPGFVLLLVVFFHAIGIVLWLAAPAGPAIPAWSVVLVSAVAGIVMATVLLAARPETIAALRRADLEA